MDIQARINTLQAFADRMDAILSGQFVPVLGLCGSLGDSLKKSLGSYIVATDYVCQWARSWPECSDNPHFPVKHPLYADPAEAYSRAEACWEGEYGAARRRLTAHCLVKCSECIDLCEVLLVLYRIRDVGPAQINTGICYQTNIRDTLTWDNFRQRTIPRWPEFSGDVNYPVPGGRGAYYDHYHSLWSGPYGDARRRLLAFLINELEKEVLIVAD